MRRFDYLPPRIAGLRSPLIAIAGTLALLLVVDAIECHRLSDARERKTIDAQRLVQSTRAVAGVRQIESERRRLEQLADHISSIQSFDRSQANTLAWIGNQLPGDLWLSNLRTDGGAFVLEGVSDRLVSIGSAMLALHSDLRAGKPHLVSIATDPRNRTKSFRYALRLEPNRP